MRKLQAVLCQGLFFCLFSYSFAFAAPDPRDSIILESKTVNPGTGHPATRVKVFITNKDTIVAYALSLIQKSLTGGAYMTLARPRSFDSVMVPLTPTLNDMRILNSDMFNSSSPDTFVVGGFADVNNPSTWQPPNPVRKAFLEIKFDTIWSNAGTVVIDSVTWTKRMARQIVRFVNNQWVEVDVNFLKSTITVAEPEPPPCNDMNGDGGFSASDVVEALNCVFLGVGSCGPISAPADVVRLLKSLFSSPVPLVPPTPCE